MSEVDLTEFKVNTVDEKFKFFRDSVTYEPIIKEKVKEEIKEVKSNKPSFVTQKNYDSSTGWIKFFIFLFIGIPVSIIAAIYGGFVAFFMVFGTVCLCLTGGTWGSLFYSGHTCNCSHTD